MIKRRDNQHPVAGGHDDFRNGLGNVGGQGIMGQHNGVVLAGGATGVHLDYVVATFEFTSQSLNRTKR